MCIIGFRWLLWFAFIYNDIHSYILSFELCQYLQYARLSQKFRIHWSEKRIVLLQYKKYFNISILRYKRSILRDSVKLIRVSLIFCNVNYFCYEYLQIAMFLMISYFIGSLYKTHTWIKMRIKRRNPHWNISFLDSICVMSTFWCCLHCNTSSRNFWGHWQQMHCISTFKIELEKDVLFNLLCSISIIQICACIKNQKYILYWLFDS